MKNVDKNKDRKKKKEKIKFYSVCKTCHHNWISETPNSFCPSCFASNIVSEKKDYNMKKYQKWREIKLNNPVEILEYSEDDEFSKKFDEDKENFLKEFPTFAKVKNPEDGRIFFVPDIFLACTFNEGLLSNKDRFRKSIKDIIEENVTCIVTRYFDDYDSPSKKTVYFEGDIKEGLKLFKKLDTNKGKEYPGEIVALEYNIEYTINNSKDIINKIYELVKNKE